MDAGLPRRSDQIFDAALTLLAEGGYQRLTVEGIAERSGVHKTTLYRWWPSKDALLGRALVESRLLDVEMPDTGTLRGDLEHLVGSAVRLLTAPATAPVIAAVLAGAGEHPALAGHARAFFADRLGRERAVVDRAVARGELPPDVDAMLLFDLLGGAVWVRVLLRRLPPDPDTPARVVRAVLHGLSA